MERLKLDVIDNIREDAALFAKVSQALGIRPSSLPETLARNGNKLNQYSIVKMVADHIGKNPDEVVEEIKSEA